MRLPEPDSSGLPVGLLVQRFLALVRCSVILKLARFSALGSDDFPEKPAEAGSDYSLASRPSRATAGLVNPSRKPRERGW